MARCPTTVAALVLCAFSSVTNADDWSDTVFLSQEDLAVRSATAVYPDRWCVKTFVQSASATTASRADAALDAYPFVESDYQADFDDPSLANRLMGLRTMRLATLWRGRNQALVFGLNKSGYLGIRLDEVYASSR